MRDCASAWLPELNLAEGVREKTSVAHCRLNSLLTLREEVSSVESFFAKVGTALPLFFKERVWGDNDEDKASASPPPNSSSSPSPGPGNPQRPAAVVLFTQ